MLSKIQEAMMVIAIPFSLPKPISLSRIIKGATIPVATGPIANPIVYDSSIGILKISIPISAYTVASIVVGIKDIRTTINPFPLKVIYSPLLVKTIPKQHILIHCAHCFG